MGAEKKKESRLPIRLKQMFVAGVGRLLIRLKQMFVAGEERGRRVFWNVKKSERDRDRDREGLFLCSLDWM